MMQRYDLCKEQLSAKIMLMHGEEQQNIDTLHAFRKIVTDLADVEEEEVTCSKPLESCESL